MIRSTWTDGLRDESIQAIEAVTHGLALARAGGADAITSKGGRDLVTDADVAVEDSIRERLTAAFGAPVIGEERGGTVPTDGSRYWLVDPICGTRNIASGTTLYSVNLALVEDGEVTVGVSGDPSTGDIAFAECGSGAWALAGGNRRELHTDASSHLITVEDGKSTGAAREHAAAFFNRFIRQDRWDLRSLGTTLAAVYVATGRFAAYAVFFVPSLHAAPGTLLVTEAGGTISDVEGAPWSLDSDSLIASATPELHEELLAIASATHPAAGP